MPLPSCSLGTRSVQSRSSMSRQSSADADGEENGASSLMFRRSIMTGEVSVSCTGAVLGDDSGSEDINRNMAGKLVFATTTNRQESSKTIMRKDSLAKEGSPLSSDGFVHGEGEVFADSASATDLESACSSSCARPRRSSQGNFEVLGGGISPCSSLARRGSWSSPAEANTVRAMARRDGQNTHRRSAWNTLLRPRTSPLTASLPAETASPSEGAMTPDEFFITGSNSNSKVSSPSPLCFPHQPPLPAAQGGHDGDVAVCG